MMKPFRVIEKSLQLDDTSSEAWYYLAIAYGYKHDLDKELGCLLKCLWCDPENYRAWDMLVKLVDKSFGVTYSSTELLKSIRDLSVRSTNEKFLQKMDFLLKMHDAILAYNEKNYSKAISLCNALVDTSGSGYGSFRILSSSYKYMGNDQAAVVIAKKWTTAEPDDAFAWYILGVRYQKICDKENAIAAFQKAVQLNPKLRKARQEIEKLSH